MAKIYVWSPNKDTKNDRINGIFVTRVPPNTPNALNFTGERVDKQKYDYWAIPAGQVSGVPCWFDLVTSDFGTKIVLVLKASKDGVDRIHKIEIPYNIRPLREILNSLYAIIKNADDAKKPWAFQNVAYYKKQNGDFVYENGKKKIVQFFRFEGCKPFFENFKEYSEENGLSWEKKTKVVNQKNVEYFDYQKEEVFWRRCAIQIQTRLIEYGQAIPLNYNSVICRENPIPDGWPGLDQANLIWVNYWHEQNRGKYQYANSSRPEQVDADDALDAKPQPEQPKAAPEQQKGMTVKASANAPLPDNDPFNLPSKTYGQETEDNTENYVENYDDLPF